MVYEGEGPYGAGIRLDPRVGFIHLNTHGSSAVLDRGVVKEWPLVSSNTPQCHSVDSGKPIIVGEQVHGLANVQGLTAQRIRHHLSLERAGTAPARGCGAPGWACSCSCSSQPQPVQPAADIPRHQD